MIVAAAHTRDSGWSLCELFSHTIILVAPRTGVLELMRHLESKCLGVCLCSHDRVSTRVQNSIQ